MGCSVSKVDRDEELRAGFGSVQWITNEAAGNSRGRNGSLELLRPVELEDDLPVSQPQSPMKEKPPRGSEIKVDPKTELGDVKRVEEVVKMVVLEKKTNEVVEENKGGVSAEEFELGMPPASPSFRFYFSEAMQEFDVDDFRVEQHGNEDLISKDIKKDNPHPRSRESSNGPLTSGEELDVKKVKAKRFRVLMRVPSAVFRSLFNVGNCYSCHSSAAAAANVPPMPKLITGKAA